MRYVPEEYDRLFGQFQRSNRMLAQLVRQSVPFDPEIVVDACCGTGIFLENLREEFPNTEILGIDIQPDLIAAARAKTDTRERVSYVVGDFVEEYKRLRLPAKQLVVLKACYHFVSDRISISDILRRQPGRTAVCVIERSVYSAEAYPVFPRAKAALRSLTDVSRQNDMVLTTTGHTDVVIFSAGEVVKIPTDVWCNTLLSKQLSYLRRFQKSEIESWTNMLRGSHPVTVPVFEEYRGYCFIS